MTKKKKSADPVTNPEVETPPAPPENPAPKADDISLDGILQQATANMPEISEHVIELQQKNASQNVQQPTIAPVNEPKKRGRPAGSKTAQKPGMKSTVSPSVQPIMHDPDAEARMVASNAAAHFVQVSGLMLAGSDGMYAGDEQKVITISFDQYFAAKGIKDFPPGVALALGLSGYYMRIFATPPAQGKIKLGWQWAKNKMGSITFFKKRANKNAKREDRSQSDTGNDNVGKNDTGQEDRG